MDLKKINTLLKDLDNLSSIAKMISTNQSGDFYEEKGQGEGGIKVEIYDINEPDVFLKVVTKSDSYGSEQRVSEVQFVGKSEKVVTVFESI